jgi:hypothetical protein
VATVTSQLPEADTVWSHRLLAEHLTDDASRINAELH